MNSFTAVVLALAVVSASASHLGHYAAHVPSGSVSVGHDGAVIAGPSGSVRTDNGLHGHGASAQLSGPAGDVATHAGHARLAGPGISHLEHVSQVIAAPVVHQAPVATYTNVVGPSAHATIVGPTSYANIVAPVASVQHAGAVQSWGHQEVIAVPAVQSWRHQEVIAVPAVQSWGHHGVISHGLVAHGHQGW